MSYFYLSNPYNGTNEQRIERAMFCAKACGKLIKNRIYTLSPIVHNHGMLEHCDDFSLEDRRNIILDFDFSLLKASMGMIVLKLEGWKESYGVGEEIKFCMEHKIPIYYYDYDQIMSGQAGTELRKVYD